MIPDGKAVKSSPTPAPEPGHPPAAVTAGYTVVLPPAWHQIPLRKGTGAAIKRIVGKTFAQLPDGVPRDAVTQYRIDLERRLTAAATKARSRGGVHMYLPVALRHRTPIAASFVVSQGSLGSLDDIDPDLVMSSLASGGAVPGDDGISTVTVDGERGLRFEHTAPADPGSDIHYASRRVDYVVPVPGERDRWLVVAFSTLGGGDPDDQYARILVELFDAIMSTFRWTRARGGVTMEAP